ncbi:MAG TPA: hypothetical protein VIL09_05365 [Microvirga sp.]|jgi:hypothetical protein
MARGKSYAVNNAAKDDVLCVSSNGQFNLAALLANDPGSAKLISINNALVTEVAGQPGVYQLDPSLAGGSFTYTVQMANGTLSTATVMVNSEYDAGGQQLFNEGFDFDQVPAGQEFAVLNNPTGWTNNLPGTTVEVVASGHAGVVTPDGSNWLDTQSSPGGINIAQSYDLEAGRAATITFDIALHGGQGDLVVVWDGQVVDTINAADFAGKGQTEFTTLSFDVVGSANAETLQIVDTGPSDNQGYAINSVSLNTSSWWTC